MQTRVRLVAIALSLAVGGAACGLGPGAVPVATPAEGPSQFLAGFSVAAVAASINSTPNGPRCPKMPPALPSDQEARDSLFGGWTVAGFTAACDDPGDGTALAQAWGAAISAEIRRLGAEEAMAGTSVTASGAKFTDTWDYRSSGLRGRISVLVLPAPDGRYWVILRIFEPS